MSQYGDQSMFKKFSSNRNIKKLFPLALILALIIVTGVAAYVISSKDTSFDNNTDAASEYRDVVYAESEDADMVTQDGDNLRFPSDGRSNWLGTGKNEKKSYFGVRFTEVPIRQNTEIERAVLVLRSSKVQDVDIKALIYMEDSLLPKHFSKSNPPSTRKLEGEAKWSLIGNYKIESRVVINVTAYVRTLQQEGDKLNTTFIVKGNDKNKEILEFYNSNSRNEKFLRPKLVIEYKHNSTPTPTVTSTFTPTPTSTTTSTPTPTIKPSQTSTPSPTLSPSPSRTPTPTPTPTFVPSPTATKTPTPIPTTTPPAGVYRAFTATSYWNMPLPDNVPLVDQQTSNTLLQHLYNDNSTSYIRFSGLGSSGSWGRPIYFSYGGTPTSISCDSCAQRIRDALSQLHVPDGANPDNSSDAAMTVYDMANKRVFGFISASRSGNSWHIKNSSMHYLNSNGLDGSWTQYSDTNKDNNGHRGAPAAIIGIRKDEIEAGAIEHKLNLAINNTKASHVFPFVNDEGGTGMVPEGTVIRIKPSVDLEKKNLSPTAKIIARALQKYGAIVGDQSGGPMNIKVENTIAEGKGNWWEGRLTSDALSSLKINEDFDIVQFGYADPRIR